MNIKLTAYDKSGTLFNFDMLVNKKEDFEKVIGLLKVFYKIKSEELESYKRDEQ